MLLAIRTHGLTRRFRGGHGVHDLDLHVPAGSIYGFLGPNGAGKTTTIRLLLGLLRRDRGEIALFGQTVEGNDPAQRAHIGALVETPSLYGHLTGRQNLEITRCLIDAPRARIDEALSKVDLRDAADRPVREYSLGMRQRLGIALSLLGRPKLLILDEPSNGLDPSGILDMRRLLRELLDDGLTVFVSSHLLGEVEQFATHVGVLHQGRMRFEGTLQALRERARPRLTLRCDAPERAREVLTKLGESVDHLDEGGLSLSPRHRDDAEINRLLVQNGIGVSHLAREQTTLESLFFDLLDARSDENVAERAA
jgi:lantibiotic transport system ATP-binding protein